jgi:predicted CXXCH cytochrome family protein
MRIRLAIASLVVVCACAPGGDDPSRATASSASKPRADVVTSRASIASAGVCVPTGAHGKHETLGLACSDCHAGGGVYAFSGVILPDGSTTAGGTMTNTPGTPGHTAGSTSCSVSCHGDATPAWNQGPLACTGCHGSIANQLVAARSTHAAPSGDIATQRAACQACHLVDAHRSGVVRLATADGAVVSLTGGTGEADSFCVSCHDGIGKGIAGKPPPVLNGFSTTDPHGAAGTTAALACTSCHAAHGSKNELLLVDTNNATGGTVERGGVGTLQVCSKCHTTTPPHQAQGCLTQCHSHTDVPLGHPTADPVKPSFPCFYCHTHRGVVHFQYPSGCNHCHSNGGWLPPTVEVVPPAITNATISGTTTSATVAWSTNEFADSWVAAGSGGVFRSVTDTRDLTTRSLQLTGLTTGTFYTIELRSADKYRNVATASAGFTPGGPSAPVLVDEYHAFGLTSADVEFRWNAVSGTGLQYRVEVAATPAFVDPIVSPWQATTSYRVTLASAKTYHWRVRARNASGYESLSFTDAVEVSTNVSQDCDFCHGY